MTTEFCEHLEKYGKQYTSAEAAYQDCLQLMDTALTEGANSSLAKKIIVALNGWEMQTRELRVKFSRLTENGDVLLPREGQNSTPVCGHCGALVPRLEFREFEFKDDGTVLFRGQELRAAEAVPA